MYIADIIDFCFIMNQSNKLYILVIFPVMVCIQVEHHPLIIQCKILTSLPLLLTMTNSECIRQMIFRHVKEANRVVLSMPITFVSKRLPWNQSNQPYALSLNNPTSTTTTKILTYTLQTRRVKLIKTTTKLSLRLVLSNTHICIVPRLSCSHCKSNLYNPFCTQECPFLIFLFPDQVQLPLPKLPAPPNT